MVKHIFIIGSKSIGQYGGYETFVDKLTEQHQYDPLIKYHIACKANGTGYMDESKLDGVEIIKRNADGKVTEFTYHNAHAFKIACPNIGSAVAVYYDCLAMEYCIKYCKENNIEHPIFYILTCRIGLFINSIVKQIKAVGGAYVLNPDGHEWKRAKWPAPVRCYWKWSEKKMVSLADLVICDSVNIEEYIRLEYNAKNTVYIAYGADINQSTLSDTDPNFIGWLKEKGLKAGEYYLTVGRFVPENNYETMIREFMTAHSKKDFALVTNVNSKFLEELENKLHWKKDHRIKFVGTVYDKELLKKIREKAYAYLHGHEVGGTNPSLLEAMSSTQLNLLLDVSFNREVGADSALYWNKEKGSLSNLLDNVDILSKDDLDVFSINAKKRIRELYNWPQIAKKYKEVWGSFL